MLILHLRVCIKGCTGDCLSMAHKDLLVQSLKDNYTLIPMIYYNLLSYLGTFWRGKKLTNSAL